MSKIKFKHTVLQTASLLIQHGYQVHEPSSASDVIQFWKNPVPGIRCEINIELITMFIPPVREFNIGLYRRRLQDFPKEEPVYLPVTFDLPNLLKYFYKLNVLPPGKYWEFIDEKSLAEQFVKAQSLLIEYGIRWLEDPTSNMEWVRNSKKPTAT